MYVIDLMFLIDEMKYFLFILAIFGFSNHVYDDKNAFEKTRHGCQLLKTFLIDLTDNYTKPITDEKELIHRALGLLSDNKV